MNRIEMTATKMVSSGRLAPLELPEGEPVACVPAAIPFIALAVSSFGVGFGVTHAHFGYTDHGDADVPSDGPASMETMSVDRIMAAYAAVS